MNYFKDCQTLDQVKATYKALAKRYHPDVNPNTQAECTKIMQEINAQYEQAVKRNYRAESGDKYDVNVEDAHLSYADIIKELVNIEGIEIEVCGYWLWVGGNTKPHCGLFNRLGFKFSGPKVKWYHAPNIKRGKVRGHYTMEQIRSKYGSEKIETKRSKLI
jgi:hypothetical protein